MNFKNNLTLDVYKYVFLLGKQTDEKLCRASCCSEMISPMKKPPKVGKNSRIIMAGPS